MLIDGFTRRYNITRLFYYEYETTPNSLAAISREKEIKGWSRKKKITLIESTNPRWGDLAGSWYR
jgi:putative endonuclease